MAYLTVCAMYWNEARYLEEWIEFHRLVGVERFFLYNHMSTDGHREVLAPYIEEGTVTLKDWPEDASQASAYRDCLDERREQARWIAFIDLDEFLFSPTLAPLPELLAEYERWPGVAVNWAMFGAAGHEIAPAGLVLENYTRRVPDGHPFNRLCKCVVDPRRTIQCGAGISAHSFDYTEDHAVDENFAPRDKYPRGKTESLSFERLRVNHYYMKSKEQWLAKIAATRPDTSLRLRHYPAHRYAEMNDLFSRVRDETIQAYLPELKAALAARSTARRPDALRADG